VVVDGRPVLPPDQVPDLVDRRGAFDVRLVRAGMRFFFLPRVRRQLAAEIRAQFAAFQATGLALDHVNAHRHLHLHPTVLSLVLAIGRDYGLRAVRVPLEPLGAAWRLGGMEGRGRAVPLGRALVAAPWARLMRWRLRRAGVLSNDCIFGLSTSGTMTEATVLRILEGLPSGLAELYFHPATANHPTVALPLPTARHAAELAALTSPRVRAALAAAGLEPGGWSDAR
jgi:hopanoid biosynthesis associated protein HpnK